MFREHRQATACAAMQVRSHAAPQYCLLRQKNKSSNCIGGNACHYPRSHISVQARALLIINSRHGVQTSPFFFFFLALINFAMVLFICQSVVCRAGVQPWSADDVGVRLCKSPTCCRPLPLQCGRSQSYLDLVVSTRYASLSIGVKLVQNSGRLKMQDRKMLDWKMTD